MIIRWSNWTRAGDTTQLHELSLVEGIIEAVEEEAKGRGGNVRSFKVKVGELAQFDLRLVRELLRELRQGTPLQSTRVRVELERAKIRCLTCNSEWNFDDVIGHMSADEKEVVHFLPELFSCYFRCPSCSKSYFEIEQGRSVRVAEVTLDV
jgi:Zn finger protein HypA/HybF involved in hydrogenase expression